MKNFITPLLLIIFVWNISYGQGTPCPNPKLEQAEREAYQELIKARADAATVLSGEISAIEDAKKKQQDQETLKYSNDLKTCGNDTVCSLQKKTEYDDGVFIILAFAKKELAKAQDKEKAANEAAQKNYDEAVRKAKELYPTLSFVASGQDGPTVYSGTVCDTGAPFELTGTNGPIVYPFKFTPTSDTTGSFSFITNFSSAVLKGGGTYKIKGLKTGTAQIEMETSSTGQLAHIKTSGSGPAHIILTWKK